MRASVLKIFAAKGSNFKHSKTVCTCLLLISLLLGSLFTATTGIAGHPEVKEEQLKAVYLYNFLHFAFWPENQEEQRAEKDTVIGVLGDSSIKAALEELQNSLAKSGKTPITVKYYEKFSAEIDFTACSILYVSDSERNHFEEIVSRLTGLPVLSVASSSAFLQKGGMIVLQEYEGRIRYKINRDAAKKSGIRLSSQLLQSSL